MQSFDVMNFRFICKMFILFWIFIGILTPARSQFVKERRFMGRAAIGTAEVLTQEALCSLVLYLSPGEFSNWEDKYWQYWGSNLKRGGFTTGEKILVTLINPYYVLNNGYKQD